MTCLHVIQRTDFGEVPQGKGVEEFIVASLKLERDGPRPLHDETRPGEGALPHLGKVPPSTRIVRVANYRLKSFSRSDAKQRWGEKIYVKVPHRWDAFNRKFLPKSRVALNSGRKVLKSERGK
jgi:hypothetical protein